MNIGSRSAVAAMLLAAASAVPGQPACSSDGTPAPAALLERFVNADCEGCWTDAKVREPKPGEVVLDWIVPGTRGDDAPLSAAARDDGLARLAALGRAVPAHDDLRHRQRRGPPARLRVAHGLPFNGYLGASIELRQPGPGPWQAWLLLVETIPAGSERTPVERNLVRNVLRVGWDARHGRQRLFESRPMNIPEGARPERLRVVGLLEDARGRIRGIAQSRCAAPAGKG